MRKIDDVDRAILQALQQDARLTAEQLGQISGLSPTAALKRVKKLREDEVILSEVAIISPRAVGQDLMASVLVTLNRDKNENFEVFKEAVRAAPEVMQAYGVTGDADYLLIISIESMDQYETFKCAFFQDNEIVKDFKTMVMLDRVKMGMAIPIKTTA
ncbi:MAG: Lrp/AsnC family transcriptional regulator [Pseudomonadota bacterium]